MMASISTDTPLTLPKSAPHVILNVEDSEPRVITSLEGLGRGQGMGSVPVVGIERVDATLPLGEEEVVVALRPVAVSISVFVIVIMLAASALVIVSVSPLREGDLGAHFLALLTAMLPPTPPPTVAATITNIKASTKKKVVGRKPQIVFLLPESP
jgi:hypothetical protein